mgnify:FL=1|jgi:hypothetical protein
MKKETKILQEFREAANLLFSKEAIEDTQKQTPPVINTFPEDFIWECEEIPHNLSGLSLDNAKAYHTLIEKNKYSQVLALIELTDLRETLLINIAAAWECSESDAHTIISLYLKWGKEESDILTKTYEDTLKKYCEKTKFGEELAETFLKQKWETF